MVFRDVYTQPDALDPVLDAEIVLELVRRHKSDARAVTGVDESGGEARAYAVDGDLILKTQRPHRLRQRTNLEKEVLFLRHLEGVQGVSVPRVLCYGREGDVEYICMTRVPGVAALHARLGGTARANVLGQLGRALRRIHRIAQGPLVQSGLFLGDRSPADFKTRLEIAFDRAAQIIRERPDSWPLGRSPADVAGEALHALPRSDEFVALHSNPGPEHAFIDLRAALCRG